MVLEQLINTNWLQRIPLYAVLLGFIYTIIGSVTGYVFFLDNFSISLLFMVTLLLVPSLMNLLTIEEEREKMEGMKNFLKNHKDIFQIYLFLSIGVFLGYMVMIWFITSTGVEINMVLNEQLKVLGDSISVEQIVNFDANNLAHMIGIFASNIGVAIVFFVLSFFYGAGSIFLIVWNASIFSAFIYTTLQNISQGVNHAAALLGVFSMYMIPEIAGFLLAAIAGGVISKAVVREHFMSDPFKNVLKDAFYLLLAAFGLLLISAFLEAFIGVNMIQALVG